MKRWILNLLYTLPLMLFLWFLRGGGSGGVDWCAAYGWAGAAGAAALALAAWRGGDWLLAGTNLWLVSGAASCLAGWWWPLTVYMRLGPGSPVAWAALTALGWGALALRNRPERAWGAFLFAAAAVLGCAMAALAPGRSPGLVGLAVFVPLMVLERSLRRRTR